MDYNLSRIKTTFDSFLANVSNEELERRLDEAEAECGDSISLNYLNYEEIWRSQSAITDTSPDTVQINFKDVRGEVPLTFNFK